MNLPELIFSAAVERPLSVVFRTDAGRWEGHDYTVEVVAQRKGLNRCDVVVDFRKLEEALDRLLEPLQGRLLSDLGLKDPLELAQRIAREVAPQVPQPAYLAEVALRDGQGRRRASVRKLELCHRSSLFITGDISFFRKQRTASENGKGEPELAGTHQVYARGKQQEKEEMAGDEQ